MSDKQHSENASEKPRPRENGGSHNDESRVKPEPQETLTPEEQMALYEKDLKENDWGHQPC